MRVRIGFEVVGYVTQIVELTESISPSKLRSMLETGHILTTIQENGEVVRTVSGKQVGTVVSVDNDCTYENFDVGKIDNGKKMDRR